MSHKSVYAIAVSAGQALQIEEDLALAGFSNEEISALIPDMDPAPQLAPDVRGSGDQTQQVGGVLGAAMDLLSCTGIFKLPGVGQLVAVGPLLAALNTIATGAVVIGVAGALVGLGIPKDAANRYEHRVGVGDILISVLAQTSEKVEKAKEVFKNAKAEVIAVTSILDAGSVMPS